MHLYCSLGTLVDERPSKDRDDGQGTIVSQQGMLGKSWWPFLGSQAFHDTKLGLSIDGTIEKRFRGILLPELKLGFHRLLMVVL